MKPIVVGRIDSAETLVVDVAAFPREMAVVDLAETLCVPIGAILQSITLPPNENFAKALYETLEAEVWKGELRTDDGLLFPIPTLAELEQGINLAEHEDLYYFLSRGAAFGPEDPAQWILPKQEFQVLIGDWDSVDLNSIFTHYEGRHLCVAFPTDEETTTAIEQLRSRVEPLEAALRRASEERAEHRQHLGILQNALGVVSWLRKDQRNRGLSSEEFKQNTATIDNLHDQFLRLSVRLEDRLANPPEAREAARKLLRLLDVSVSQHAGFHAAARSIMERPFRLSATDSQAFFDLIERAFAALAASPLAERFAKEHLCDLLLLVCDRESPSANDVFAGLGATTVGAVAREEWKNTVAEIRAGAGIKGGPSTTLFSTLVRAGGVGRSSLSILPAALGKHTIFAFLRFLHKAQGGSLGKSPFRGTIAQQVAGTLFRFITFTSVQARMEKALHFAPPGTGAAQHLALAKSEALHRVERIISNPTMEPTEVAKELKKFRFDKQVYRTPSVLGGFVALHVITLLSLMNDDEAPLEEKAFRVAQLAGEFTHTSLRVTEYVLAQRFIGSVEEASIKRIWDIQKGLGYGLIGIGAIVALMKLRDLDKGDAVHEALLIGDTVATGLSTASAIFINFTRLAMLSAPLATLSVMVQIGVIVGGIVYEMVGRSPRRLLEMYLQLLEGDTSKSFEDSDLVQQIAATVIAEIREIIDDANDSALDPFKAETGHAADNRVHQGRLTIHKAIKLGFNQFEMGHLFGMDPVRIVPFMPNEPPP